MLSLNALMQHDEEYNILDENLSSYKEEGRWGRYEKFPPHFEVFAKNEDTHRGYQQQDQSQEGNRRQSERDNQNDRLNEDRQSGRGGQPQRGDPSQRGSSEPSKYQSVA